MSDFALHELPAPCWQRKPAGNLRLRDALSERGTAHSHLLHRPDDVYELDADRIADDVMRNPVTRQEPSNRWAARADGLDNSTLDFMQANLGSDFRDVRIHRDAAAASKARAVQARAFTVGRDIVFGAGEYAPATSEGRRLIAHELVHVLQQANVSGGLNSQSTEQSGNVMMQRKPDKTATAGFGVPQDLLLHSRAASLTGLDYEQRIRTLAANPDHAAFEWKRLSRADQMGVAVQMAAYFGDAFAKQFVAARELNKKPGFERADADAEPANLTKRGYRRAGIQQQIDVEVWFRPSGDRLHRSLEAAKSKQVEKLGKQQVQVPGSVSSKETSIDDTEVKEQAEALLEEMGDLNEDMEDLVKAEDLSGFTDKWGDFSESRKKLADLLAQHGSVLDDEDRAAIIQERKEQVSKFLQTHSKAYGAEQTDWSRPTNERD